MHKETHPLAGQTIKIARGQFAGAEYRVEDWWDKLTGKSWLDSNVIASLNYAAQEENLGPNFNLDTPDVDEVLYGKIDGLGYLIHQRDL